MEENNNTNTTEGSSLKVATQEPNQVVEVTAEEKKSPVLTTEDKVEIFKGTTFYQVDLQTFEITEKVENELDVIYPEYKEINNTRIPLQKFFSTKEAAEKFIFIKYSIQGKEVQLRRSAMNDTLAHAVILMNVLGKPYWEELKKVFTVGEPTLSTINAVFE